LKALSIISSTILLNLAEDNFTIASDISILKSASLLEFLATFKATFSIIDFTKVLTPLFLSSSTFSGLDANNYISAYMRKLIVNLCNRLPAL
jgi:hypothetical protein